ncbi:MAG: hypothetical protein AAFX85_14420 [Pseudomonadota bacterium]
MHQLLIFATLLVTWTLWPVGVAASDAASNAPTAPPFALSPPRQDAPVRVNFDFELHDINDIDSVLETFEFTGVMTLTWRDPREAFDPALAGVDEKLFQGTYQFDELATGWYPQVMLINESGAYSRSAVQLRVRPDGTSILREKITAVAEASLTMRLFPFDSHRLEANFALLGYDGREAALDVATDHGAGASDSVSIPGWSIGQVGLSREVSSAGPAMGSGAVVLGIEVTREASYIRRLITFPMLIIVVLSFSIFWMDKSSLGDRNSVSFIGVLTGVAFQHIVVSVMPPTSDITVMHAFLFISFLVMAATIPVNLAVARMDREGKADLGDLIDRRCRWLFPLVYVALIAASAGLLLA